MTRAASFVRSAPGVHTPSRWMEPRSRILFPAPESEASFGGPARGSCCGVQWIIKCRNDIGRKCGGIHQIAVVHGQSRRLLRPDRIGGGPEGHPPGRSLTLDSSPARSWVWAAVDSLAADDIVHRDGAFDADLLAHHMPLLSGMRPRRTTVVFTFGRPGTFIK